MFKKALFGLISLFSFSSVFAAVELSLDTLQFPSGTGIYQYTNPSLTLIIRNSGVDTASITTPSAAGFISCTVGSETVFSSDPISNLTINPDSTLQFPISLASSATKNLGNQSVTCNLGNYNNWIILQSSLSTSYTVLERVGGRFDTVLDTVRDPIKNKVDGPVAELGVSGLKSFAYSLIDRFAVRAAVFVGVFFALLALFRIMFKTDDGSLKQVRGLLIWGLVGVLIIMSAKFIGNVVYTDILGNGEIGNGDFNMITIVSKTYDLVVWPLLKIAFYIMISVLFVILLIRVFSFVTSTAEDIRTKSMQIIISSIVGLFVMIASKQLVEGVYGKEALIRNSSAVTVTDVGGAFLSNANIPIIYTIIQRIMGLSGFVILALIIFQTFKMLTNPTDESNMTGIRKTLLYALIGMLVIGAGYLIVNVVMVN